ncbi:MAG: Uma2 family endonuclease [Aggregatilineales bacterium]
MTIDAKDFTAEAYLEFTQLPENDGKRFELIDGVIIEMPPSSKRNTVTAILFAHFVTGFVLENNLGYVTGADGGFEISPKTVLQPDVGFIRKERVTSLDGVTFAGAPDLAIEVISPSESSYDIRKKTDKYFDAGAQMVINVFTDDRLIQVWTLDGTGKHVETYGMNDVFDGGDVLPGFTLPIKKIFPD